MLKGQVRQNSNKIHNSEINLMKHLGLFKIHSIIVLIDHPQSQYKVFWRILKLQNFRGKLMTSTKPWISATSKSWVSSECHWTTRILYKTWREGCKSMRSSCVHCAHLYLSVYYISNSCFIKLFSLEICTYYKKTGFRNVFHPKRCGNGFGKESFRTNNFIPSS